MRLQVLPENRSGSTCVRPAILRRRDSGLSRVIFRCEFVFRASFSRLRRRRRHTARKSRRICEEWLEDAVFLPFDRISVKVEKQKLIIEMTKKN
jgi:hypothetical protein